MTQETDLTINDCLASAFQALLRGDLEERDKLCAMAERAFEGEAVADGNKSVMGIRGQS